MLYNRRNAQEPRPRGPRNISETRNHALCRECKHPKARRPSYFKLRQEDIELPKTYSRDQIPSRREQIPRPETALKYKHFAYIADDITPYQENLKVGLLIGNNCVRAIKPRGLVPGKQ